MTQRHALQEEFVALARIGASAAGVPLEDVLGPSTRLRASMVRAALVTVLRERHWGSEEIGRELGRGRTTMINLRKRYEHRAAVDEEYAALLLMLRRSW